MKAVVEHTVGQMTHTKSYFDRRDLVTASICAAIGHVDGIAYMEKAISGMANTGAVIQIGAKEGKAILSTKAILDQERRIIAITKSRMVDPSIFDGSAVKAAIADTGLSQEQRDFLEDIFGPGGCVPGLGGAGTGKTRAAAKVKEVCQASGLRLLLASPEWRAAGVLAKELESEGKYSVDRLVNQHEAGRLLLGRKTLFSAMKLARCTASSQSNC